MMIGTSRLIYKNHVAIVDYGINNVSSVAKALKRCKINYLLTDSPDKIAECSHIILPGVGSFDAGVEALRAKGLDEAIISAVTNGAHVLGICLGMQLLFSNSEESKKLTKGLDLLEGTVVKFSHDDGVKVPHMGWNEVFSIGDRKISSLFEKTDQYFVHSFYVIPKDKEIISCESFHGVHFPAIVVKGHIYGVQFHPEKSLNGIQFMQQFCSL